MPGNVAFVNEDASLGSGEDKNMLVGNSKHQPATPNSGHCKRSRKVTGDAIINAMLELPAASKMKAAATMRNEERFTISKCVKVLDETQGVDQTLYFMLWNYLKTHWQEKLSYHSKMRDDYAEKV